MSRILSVSVPDELLAEAESVAATQGRTKSELVRDALRSHLKLLGLRALQEEARERAERRGIGPDDAEDLVDETRKQPRP